MEFEKLKEIIADVLNVEADDITEDTKFVDDRSLLPCVSLHRWSKERRFLHIITC